MRSVMSHSFSQVPQAKIPRSSFNRSGGYKTTLDAGYLVPVFVDEVLPGDTFTLNMSVFARLATPLHPFMDNVFLDSFFFFVPNRLVWTNWQKFNGEQDDPGDSTDYMTPIMTSPGAGGYTVGSLQDYFGLPTGVTGYVHQAMPLRAYNLIYNEWFRDQNLQNSVVVDKDDGPDTVTDYVLLRRGKRHDYFTGCLPWPQKGPSVPLPLGTEAPIRGKQYDDTVTDILYLNAGNPASSDRPTTLETTAVATSGNAGWRNANGNVAIGDILRIQQDGQGTGNTRYGYNYADLSDATASTINALREAFQLQRLYERDARGGTRYTEIIRSHFGVVSPDARLQRPEYLGGGSSPINVHPISQTSETTVTSPQGNLAAMGTVGFSGHGFTKSFTEHGHIIGLVSARADLNYQQGLNRMWSRRTRFEYYWPALSHIGEQAVLNQEIYCTATATDDDVFGYQERYAEYRYRPSIITGLFRSQAASSLDSWHLAQEFGSLPTLNAAFIVDDPPIDRVIAVPAEPHFLFDSHFRLQCARPMPVYSVPGLIDHF